MAYSINAQYGIDEAIDLLQEYIRTYADGPGVAYARKTIEELRGVRRSKITDEFAKFKGATFLARPFFR